MRVFLLDLGHDLREKRLAPVAVLLALALVAVPAIVLKPAGDAAPAPAAPTPTAAATQVALPGEAPSRDSDLGVFDPKDPFKPEQGARRGSVSGVAQTVTPSPSGGTSPSGGSGGAAATGSGAPGAGSGPVRGTSDTRSAPAPVVKPHAVKSYQYVADVSFGRTGSERNRRVRRLGTLPSSQDPLVVFLGISGDLKRAVFLVDSHVDQRGEGTCRPSAGTCTFLHLRTDARHNEQFLTDEQGHEYHLRLRRISRVEVKPRSSRARAGSARTRSHAPSLAPDLQR